MIIAVEEMIKKAKVYIYLEENLRIEVWFLGSVGAGRGASMLRDKRLGAARTHLWVPSAGSALHECVRACE